MIANAINKSSDIHYIRDITRGGLATLAVDLIENKKFGLELFEDKIPVRETVAGMCEVFGYDPLYLANEGKVAMVVASSVAEELLAIFRNNEFGQDAALIGEITSYHPGMAVLESSIGGKRILSRLAGEQLPRIC